MNQKLEVIKATILINGRNYPVYTGFLPAKIIDKIASVPSFDKNKENFEIARDVFIPPIKEWQRPLDRVKSTKIKEIYSDSQNDNLMANPVLLGAIPHNSDQSCGVKATQKFIELPNGTRRILDNIFEIDITYSNAKPLWILDGQHRIKGMKDSSQGNQPIPFVLLYDESNAYTGPMLAKIFTYVTTGAEPMKELHGEWMKYGFDLDPYDQPNYKNAMKTVIILCKESSLNGENNPFHNKILFNPYLTNFRTYYAFNFNMKEWAEIIATKFYGEGGTLTPEELSKEIVIAIKAFYSVDSYKDQKSKIFSNQSPHRILAEAFLLALLKNIRITGTKGSVNEWKNFFQEDCRKFNECDWRMSFVHAGQSSLSSSIGKISKEIAIDCFDLALNNPQELQNHKLTDYLEGFGGSKIKITAYQNGTKRNREVTKYEKIIDRTAGSEVFDINFNGVNRDVIQISSLSKNCRIISVWDIRYNPPQKLRNITKKKGLKITEISEFNPGRKISIESIAYSADTKKNTEIRLDKSEVK